MSVDASAVARVLGITTTFEDLREGAALNLPQRIALLAQGASAAVYSSEKRQVTSAFEGGSIYGFGSPIHLALLEFFPANGDGVGTIPVTVYPLSDDASGVPAAGSITPSGSQTTQAAYVVAVNEIESATFVIPVGASVTAVCKLIGDAIAAVLEMPVLPTYTYGTLAAAPGGGNTGNGTVDTLSVTGAPVPGDWTLLCTAAAAEGGTFQLTDPNGTVVATGLALTGGALGSTTFNQGGIQFNVNDGSTDFAVDDSFTITVPATNVVLTAKWDGTSGNDLYAEVRGDSLGTVFAMVQPTGGLVNPDVDPALALIGDVWETMGLNALEFDDTATLDKLSTYNEGRWGTLVRRPMVWFSGCTEATVAAATAASSLRTTDRTNAQLVAPGSRELPFVVAARQLARIAVVANNNPPTDYGSQRATGLVPGTDEQQWDYAERDQAVKAGSSTITLKDGEISIADVVTFHAPAGNPTPAYRFVVDIVKLQNIIYNIDLIFAVPEWDGAPLIPDGQPTVNPNARRPSSARAAVNSVIDALGLAAIISDPDATKAGTTAAIDSGNPKRLNVVVKPIKLSGNTNILDVGLRFGFFFGVASPV